MVRIMEIKRCKDCPAREWHTDYRGDKNGHSTCRELDVSVLEYKGYFPDMCPLITPPASTRDEGGNE